MYVLIRVFLRYCFILEPPSLYDAVEAKYNKYGSLTPSRGGAGQASNAKEFVRQNFRFNMKNELERKVNGNKFSILIELSIRDINGCIN